MQIIRFVKPALLVLWLIATSPIYGQGSKVTLISIHKPLEIVASEVSKQTGSLIEVDKAIKGKKLICLVKNVDESVLLQRLAEVLGATCTRQTSGDKPRYVLAQRAEVRQWLRVYNEKRIIARKRVREQIARRLERQIQEGLRASVTGTAKDTEAANTRTLAAMLPNEAWRVLAETIANGDAAEFGSLLAPNADPIYLHSVANLSEDDKEALRRVIQTLPEERQKLLVPFESLALALFLGEGTDPIISIASTTRTDKPRGFRHFRLPIAPQANESARKLAEKQTLEALLTKLSQPSSAQLGIIVRTPAEAVEIELETGEKPYPKGRKTALREELLTDLHDKVGLNIVSDYYTDDTRTKLQSSTIKEVLTEAANEFRCLFRQSTGWLLSRTTDFAEHNYFEADYPLFENVLQERQATPPALPNATPKTRILTMNTILSLCALPHEQFVKIARYQDKERGIEFPELLQQIKWWNGDRPFYVRLNMFQKVASFEMMQMGIALDTLPQVLKTSVQEDGMVRTSLSFAIFPANAFLVLEHLATIFPAAQEESPHEWNLILYWKDAQGKREMDRMIFVHTLYAGGPKKP